MRLAAIVIIMYTVTVRVSYRGGGNPPLARTPPPLLVVWLSVHSRQFFCQRMPYFPPYFKVLYDTLAMHMLLLFAVSSFELYVQFTVFQAQGQSEAS